jgi:hypothetical protein
MVRRSLSGMVRRSLPVMVGPPPSQACFDRTIRVRGLALTRVVAQMARPKPAPAKAGASL